ncbi:hypothetical protein AcW1_002411 [Taiwanofungus camphoratus]|nr:hypothetical protein AcW1_002411 [Antrodia cinnamomea]
MFCLKCQDETQRLIDVANEALGSARTTPVNSPCELDKGEEIEEKGEDEDENKDEVTSGSQTADDENNNGASESVEEGVIEASKALPCRSHIKLQICLPAHPSEAVAEAVSDTVFYTPTKAKPGGKLERWYPCQ